IGTAAQPFVGTFDGDHNSLTGFSRSGTTEQGLFGVIQGDGNLDGTNDGFVRDLVLSGFTVSGTTRVGALAGRAQGRLQRVSVLSSSVTGTAGDVGGLVGLLQAHVTDAAVDAAVTGTAAARVGGLAGSCQGSIE